MNIRPLYRAGVLAALGFGFMALFFYVFPAVLTAADARLEAYTIPFHTLYDIELFLIMTAFGGGVGIIAIAIGFAFLARLSAANVLRLTFLLAGVAFAMRVLKVFFLRARPDALLWFDKLDTYSFPSAHASASMALYGFIAVYIYARSHQAWHTFPFIVIIFLVGLSRVVLGFHHPSDVLAGYLLGFSMLALFVAFPFERFVKTKT